jgi:hypothetical protein
MPAFALDIGFIDHFTTPLEMQLTTVTSLISELYKSPQHTLYFHQPLPGNGF